MEANQIISLAISLSMAATVFGYGLHTKTEDVLYLFHKPRVLIISLLAMFIVTPAAALAIAQLFELPQAVRVAMVTLALSPVSPRLPIKESKVGGHQSYAVGLAATIILLSILLVPMLVYLLGHVMVRSFAVEASAVAKIVLTVALVPMIAGMIFDRLLPDVAERISAPIARAANVLLLVAVLVVFIPSLRTIWDLVGAGAVLAFAVFNIAALCIGHVMGGPDRDHSIVLALSCANRHPAIALAIAAANFPGQDILSAIILCISVNALVSLPYLAWQQRRAKAGAQL